MCDVSGFTPHTRLRLRYRLHTIYRDAGPLRRHNLTVVPLRVPAALRVRFLRAACPACWLLPLVLKGLGGVFSEHTFYLPTCPAHPKRAHTCSAITRRLCGWLGASGTQDLRALGLWQSCRQWRAQPWSCIDAAPGRRLQRRSSSNILTAWPGRVAQAPGAGRARAPWSCSPCWRPRQETHGSGTSYSSTTK